MMVALTGCGAILDRVEQGIEDAAAESGQDIDVNFGGDNCLADWVNYPDGDLIHAQGFRSNDVEVCVTSIMAGAPVDVEQGLPRMTNGNELAELEAVLALFAAQAGLPLEVLQQLSTGDLSAGLQSLEDSGVQVDAYGDGARGLLVAQGAEDGGEVQVTFGVICQGSC